MTPGNGKQLDTVKIESATLSIVNILLFLKREDSVYVAIMLILHALAMLVKHNRRLS